MQVGIIGLPMSGKTTICNAVTQTTAETANFSTGRCEVKSSTVDVPDPRVDRLAALFDPRKVTYAKVQFNDITGVSRGSASGTSFDPQVLGALGRCDALLQIVRAFDNDSVPHPELTVDPDRDIELIDMELILFDLGVVERRVARILASLPKARGDVLEQLQNEKTLMERLAAELSQGTPVRAIALSEAEQALIRGFQLLTAKPAMIVLNVNDNSDLDQAADWYRSQQSALVLGIKGALEMEIAQLPVEERAAFLNEFGIDEPGLNLMLRECYDMLGLMSFFTVGDDEVRAWTVRRGATAVEAAGVIHSDLARGFIRAEVISYDDMIACGTLAEARRQGKLRLEGKQYVVQDGDVLSIRFNV